MKKQSVRKSIAWGLSLIMMLSCAFGMTTVVRAEETQTEPLAVAAWSITLSNDLSLNLTVDAAYFTEYGYEDPAVTFVMGSRTVTVTEYSTEKYAGYYTFSLTDIAPHQIGETVTATFSATYGGETVWAEAKTYSVKAYCYDTLEMSDNAALKTLVVDLLNYCAATQTYVGSTDALVNAELTDGQRALGTQTDVTLEKHSNASYQTVDSPLATWVGAYLTLNDTVEMKFVFNTESTDGLRVRISTKDPLNAEASGTDYDVTALAPYKDGGYLARFDWFHAGQMREIVYVTVLDAEDNAVSNTYAYSIESYAYAKQNDENESLAELVKAMMKYGDAAAAYAHEHTWGEATYEWNADHTACTATVTCALDENHKKTETAIASKSTAGNCETGGTHTYTATFMGTEFDTQIKTESFEAGHDYQMTYHWEYGGAVCHAKQSCYHCADTTKEEIAMREAVVITVTGDCSTGGTLTRTATFADSTFATQIKTEEFSAGEHVFRGICSTQCESCDKTVRTVEASDHTILRPYTNFECDVCLKGSTLEGWAPDSDDSELS